MGLSSSKHSNENLKWSAVKFQVNQVTSFSGNPLKWYAWKKKFRAAIGTSGMLKVIDDDKYHLSNPADNETIFHILQVATADGNASHLEDKYDKDRDGKSPT